MIVIIGGGPAGFFAAITARETDPGQPVVLLEKSPAVLAKVKISGGGRCNTTHACFEPRDLAANYPRGQRELVGPFTRWGVAETIKWFADHKVELKTEPDGRMFPVTDSSATIVDGLIRAARDAGVEVRTGCRVETITPDPSGNGFTLGLAGNETLSADRVLLATGGKTSSPRLPDGPRAVDGYSLACGLGHSLVEPVPSLFTFRITNPLLEGLAGVSVPMAEVRLVSATKTDRSLRQSGPLLITHRGLSGPAVLRLSAWGARRFHDLGYQFEISVNWLPDLAGPDLENNLQEWSRARGKQLISTGGPFPLPRRLWTSFVASLGVADDAKWGDLDRSTRARMVTGLTDSRLNVTGQDTFKEEFVTCGGVPLKEIDFRTMASRVCPGLHLAGEILNIDGVTGGFNFQSCWTTGYLAGRGLVGAAP